MAKSPTSKTMTSNPWTYVLKTAKLQKSKLTEADLQYFDHLQDADENKTHLLALLLQAVKRGKLQPFEHLSLLPTHYRKELLSSKDVNGADLLTVACVCSKTQIALHLIDKLQADVQTPVSYCAKMRLKENNYVTTNRKAVEVLIDNGLLDLLVSRGADLNLNVNLSESDSESLNLLLEACEHLNFNQVSHLIKLGANPELYDKHGGTVLMRAVFNKDAEQLLHYLMTLTHFKVDVNKANEDYQTALHLAVLCNNTKAAGLLLQNGAKLTQNDQHLTPPQMAAVRSLNELVDFFISFKHNNGSSLMTSAEIADTLELLGCSYFATILMTKVVLGFQKIQRESRKGVSMWLRAERERKQAGLPPPDYESCCPALVQALNQALGDVLPINIIEHQDTSSSAEIMDDAIIDDYLQRQSRWKATAHMLIRQERILGVDCPAGVKQLRRFAKNLTTNYQGIHVLIYLTTVALQCKTPCYVTVGFKKPHEICRNLTKQRTFLRKVVATWFRYLLSEENQSVQLDLNLIVSFAETVANLVESLPNYLHKSVNSNVELGLVNEVCVTVSLCGVTELFGVLFSLFSRMCLRDEASLTVAEQAGTDSESHAEADLLGTTGLTRRFERALRKACMQKLRGLHGYSMLHFLTQNWDYKKRFLTWIGENAKEIPTMTTVSSNIMSSVSFFTRYNFGELPYKRLLELLVLADADCNARDNDGNTPLHLNAYEFAKLLKDQSDSLLTSGHSSDGCNCLRRFFGPADYLHEDSASFASPEHLLALNFSLTSVLAHAFLRQSVDDANFQPLVQQPKRFVFVFGIPLHEVFDRSHGSSETAEQNVYNYKYDRIRNSHKFNALVKYFDQFRDSIFYCNVCGSRHNFYYQYELVVPALRSLLPFTHSDIRNKDGKTYLDILDEACSYLGHSFSFTSMLHDVEAASLQCICARSVRRFYVDYKSRLPAKLLDFVDMH